MKPLVSIVMASRNYGRYITQAIESVRRQTLPSWELLIIDDGSTDNTESVVAQFQSDTRIRYFRSDRLGQPRAKNLAIRLARADRIAFLDADDLWLPTKLERQYRMMQACPEVGVSFTRRCLIAPDGSALPSARVEIPRGRILDRMLIKNHVCFSSVMVRREVFEHIGVFSPEIELAIDFDLWLRVARQYQFDYIDEVLVKYRTGHGNLSRRLNDRLMIALAMMRRCIDRRGGSAEVGEEVVREAWASTYLSMGYITRQHEPALAVKWYLKAIGIQPCIPALKGLAANLLTWAKLQLPSSRRRIDAENRLSENCSVNC